MHGTKGNFSHERRFTFQQEIDKGLVLTNVVSFRIEPHALRSSSDLRELVIEYYSDQSIRVFLHSLLGNNFSQQCQADFEKAEMKKTDYRISDIPNEALIKTKEAFDILLIIIKDKIPIELFTDLQTILSYINQVPNREFNHCVQDERYFFKDNKSEHLNKLLELTSLYQPNSYDTSDFPGRWVLASPRIGQPNKNPIIVQRINEEDGSISSYYLVRKKSDSKKSSRLELLNAYNRAPFKAYALEDVQGYEVLYEDSMTSIPPKHAKKKNLVSSLFKQTNGKWGFTRAFNMVFERMIMPIKEFDWLASHASLDPNYCNREGHTLLELVLYGELANCFGTLLAYGMNPYTAYSATSLETLYEALYSKTTPDIYFPRNPSDNLIKMMGYFKPSLKNSSRVHTQSSTQIYLLSTQNCIKSQIITTIHPQKTMEFETFFKPVSQMEPNEQEQLLALVEENFNSLITEQDKYEFIIRVASMKQPLTTEESLELWCSFIEKRFNCSLTQEKKHKYLNSISAEEQAEFHRLIHLLNNKDCYHAFWTLVDKSIVRFSFAKEISGANKFVELVYKKAPIRIGKELIIEKKLIAGFVHELLILPEDRLQKTKRIIWHSGLAVKSAHELIPTGLIPSLIFRGPLSLGLKYEVIVIGFTLNTSSYAFVEQLDNYFPKHRSQHTDEFALKVIQAIHGNDVIIHQDGMAYYIQDCIQAKNLVPSKTLSQHLFSKFNGTEDDQEEPKAKYRAVPTFFSASRRENREKLSKRDHHDAHLQELSTALESLVKPILNETQTSLAKL
ncbi:MAG: hypothetical protein P4L79_02370 [Legionella sp.]|uniref:hypothetical protein n=1 Tax=Legionella sp. TaxID=459 RepID=UPI00284E420F|nr:hypothetical protein [Legionella sp.]